MYGQTDGRGNGPRTLTGIHARRFRGAHAVLRELVLAPEGLLPSGRLAGERHSVKVPHQKLLRSLNTEKTVFEGADLVQALEDIRGDPQLPVQP